jgi:hypothetical protein
VTLFAPDISATSASETPLRTTFRLRLNGKAVCIATVGQAYQFLTNLSAIEWMEFRGLHNDAIDLLERAAGDAMMTVPATNAVRSLFARAKLL